MHLKPIPLSSSDRNLSSDTVSTHHTSRLKYSAESTFSQLPSLTKRLEHYHRLKVWKLFLKSSRRTRSPSVDEWANISCLWLKVKMKAASRHSICKWRVNVFKKRDVKNVHCIANGKRNNAMLRNTSDRETKWRPSSEISRRCSLLVDGNYFHSRDGSLTFENLCGKLLRQSDAAFLDELLNDIAYRFSIRQRV